MLLVCSWVDTVWWLGKHSNSFCPPLVRLDVSVTSLVLLVFFKGLHKWNADASSRSASTRDQTTSWISQGWPGNTLSLGAREAGRQEMKRLLCKHNSSDYIWELDDRIKPIATSRCSRDRRTPPYISTIASLLHPRLSGMEWKQPNRSETLFKSSFYRDQISV